jgi:hypothetical protein
MVGRKSATLINLEPRRNNEHYSSPDPWKGESTWKSHGEPRLIARALRRIAPHGDRSPRLTLKAGRKEGCKAGLERTCRG